MTGACEIPAASCSKLIFLQTFVKALDVLLFKFSPFSKYEGTELAPTHTRIVIQLALGARM